MATNATMTHLGFPVGADLRAPRGCALAMTDFMLAAAQEPAHPTIAAGTLSPLLPHPAMSRPLASVAIGAATNGDFRVAPFRQLLCGTSPISSLRAISSPVSPS